MSKIEHNIIFGDGNIGIGVVKHFMGGFNWFRYPKLAPYPLNLIFGAHRNPGVYDGLR